MYIPWQRRRRRRKSRSRDFLSLSLAAEAADNSRAPRPDADTGGRAHRTIYINKQLGAPRIRMSLNKRSWGRYFPISRDVQQQSYIRRASKGICICVKFKMAVKTINIQFAVLSRLHYSAVRVGAAWRGRNAKLIRYIYIYIGSCYTLRSS